MRTSALACAPLLLLLAGCGDEAAAPAEAPAAAAPASTAEPAAVAVPEELPEGVLGVILPREAVDVAAETDGVLEAVDVRPGDRVARGARVARVDTRLLRQDLEMARASLAAAEAERERAATALAEAEQKAERRRALSDLLSKEELAASEVERRSAAAGLEAARARVGEERARAGRLAASLGRAEIRAPFDGTVAQRYLDPGARVAAGTPVVRLVSAGDLMVRFAVPPADRPRLAPGATVRVRVESTGITVPATVRQVAPEIDASSQMVFVEATLEPGAAQAAVLQPGMVARVEIPGTTARTGS